MMKIMKISIWAAPLVYFGDCCCSQMAVTVDTGFHHGGKLRQHDVVKKQKQQQKQQNNKQTDRDDIKVCFVLCVDPYELCFSRC